MTDFGASGQDFAPPRAPPPSTGHGPARAIPHHGTADTMRFNLRWLREYLKTDTGWAQLLDAITMAGHEVEEEFDLGAGGNAVVVGRILEKGQHPDADKLSLCVVEGAGGERHQIVCGAQNIAEGQHVPLALVGATLPGGFKLKKTKIRGVESQGMMCSARELGVGDDHEGIWIMPPEHYPVGEPFDGIIDIKVTPNRPDALSLVGLARDVAAKIGGTLVLPEVKFPEAEAPASSAAKVVVEAKEDCPRYAARVVKGVAVGPSPAWMQRRLEAAGLRPINNVVDATNYVMLEMGHPLHAFDLDTLAKSTIVVRKARAGEEMSLLDDSRVALSADDLLICDAEKPVALAGVMGGLESEISASTTNVLLEAAYFRPATIRRTSKRLDKSTDSSYRFERGTDPKRLVNALHRAAQLIAEMAGGEVLKGAIDVQNRIPEPEPIQLRIDKLNKLSGIKFSGRDASDILVRLGFEVQRADADAKALTVAIPSHRPDIAREADLVEEIVRIHGYDKIPAVLPPAASASIRREPLARLVDAAESAFTAAGFHQAVNMSFVEEGANAVAGFGDDGLAVRVLNPLQRDAAVLRRSVAPSLLANLVHNQNHSVEATRLFEIGRAYAWKSPRHDEAEDPKSLEPSTDEPLWLAAVLCGSFKPDWRTPARDYDFWDMKGVAERLVEAAGVGRVVVEAVDDAPLLHPGRAAALLSGGRRLCWFGEVHPAIAKELGLRKRAYLLEAPLEGPLLGAGSDRKHSPLPRQQVVRRDLAFAVPNAVEAGVVERSIRSCQAPFLVSVALFDLYAGKGVEDGKRSLAFQLAFVNDERPLKDEDINPGIEKIIATLREKHGAILRG